VKNCGSANRVWRQSLFAAACVLFLGWFLMKFHMDSSSDSNTVAYVKGLLADVGGGGVPADGTGHYTALAPYVVWVPATLLTGLTGAYLIRAFVFALLCVDVVLVAAAYLWYRTLGLGSVSSLLGLVLLSTCVAFALQSRGWELDKLIEPALFLLAALAAWHRKWPLFLAFVLLAAANRETGIFVPFVGLVAPITNGLPEAGVRRRWPVIAALIIAAIEVAVLRALGPSPSLAPFIDLNRDHLAYVVGGLCLLPLLALAWAHDAPQANLRVLTYCVTPAWILFVLATDRIENGALLLAPLALLWTPLTLRAALPAERAALRPASSASGT